LKLHKKKLNGVIYYDSEGFDIIKNSYIIPLVEEELVKSGKQNEDNNYLELLLSEKDNRIFQLTKNLAEKEKSLAKALELVNQIQQLLAIEKQYVLQLQEPPVKKSFWSNFKRRQPNESWDKGETSKDIK
jgi:succinate dehydrogenase flavin-adding protein (antitoxin of CptAB toxin-antitoxin module)